MVTDRRPCKSAIKFPTVFPVHVRSGTCPWCGLPQWKVWWNLWITDSLGTGLSSFVERLSLSRRLALSKLAPRFMLCLSSLIPRLPCLGMPFHRPHYICVATLWLARVASPFLLERETQHGNGDHAYKCANHHRSVHSQRIFVYKNNTCHSDDGAVVYMVAMYGMQWSLMQVCILCTYQVSNCFPSAYV